MCERCEAKMAELRDSSEAAVDALRVGGYNSIVVVGLEHVGAFCAASNFRSDLRLTILVNLVVDALCRELGVDRDLANETLARTIADLAPGAPGRPGPYPEN